MFGILMMLVKNENNLVYKEVIIERCWSKRTRWQKTWQARYGVTNFAGTKN